MEKFLNRLAEDETLRSEFLNQTTPEGAYKVAKPYIGSMTMEEFAEQMVGLAKLMTKAESGQLSEDDLDTVAGGSASEWLQKGFEFINQFGNEINEHKDDISGVVEAGKTVVDIGKNVFGGNK